MAETYKDIKRNIKECNCSCEWYGVSSCRECPAKGQELCGRHMNLDVAKRVHAADKRKHRAELQEARDARDMARKEARGKRELADEARKAVERLRKIEPRDYDGCNTEAYSSSLNDFGRAICGAMTVFSTRDIVLSMRDRLCELIQHGWKQGVDVAALRELAARMERSVDNPLYEGEEASAKEVEDFYTALLASDARAIRKAIEGAPKPGTVCECETHAQNSDAAADWVEDNGGLDQVRNRADEWLATDEAYGVLLDFRAEIAGMLGIACEEMADEVQEAIKAELDKRLMPPGCEWPRFEDGEKVEIGDACMAVNGPSHVTSVKITPSGSFVYLRWGGKDDRANVSGDCVKRPEPDVLGADGKPIRKGETVCREALGDAYVVSDIVNGFVCLDGCPQSPCLPYTLTHTPPDTQERLDARARKLAEESRANEYAPEWIYAGIRKLLADQRELCAKGGEK